jgi:hypothetical protein
VAVDHDESWNNAELACESIHCKFLHPLSVITMLLMSLLLHWSVQNSNLNARRKRPPSKSRSRKKDVDNIMEIFWKHNRLHQNRRHQFSAYSKWCLPTAVFGVGQVMSSDTSVRRTASDVFKHQCSAYSKWCLPLFSAQSLVKVGLRVSEKMEVAFYARHSFLKTPQNLRLLFL